MDVLDPHLGMLMFAAFALVIGLVVFGGTTLAFVLGERVSAPADSDPAQNSAVGSVTQAADPAARPGEAA